MWCEDRHVVPLQVFMYRCKLGFQGPEQVDIVFSHESKLFYVEFYREILNRTQTMTARTFTPPFATTNDDG